MLAGWRDEGRKIFPVSVNISRVSLYNPKIVDVICGLTEKYNIPPEWLQLELTESAYTGNPKAIKEMMEQLQKKGFSILMDDFGSGYSVLNTIVDIPVDVIKIDRGFITSCLETDRGIYFLKHLIDMIRNLGYQIICEGVETDEQIEILRQIGCDEIQGYWYSKPLKMEDYKELLQSEKISKGGGKTPK